MLLARLVAQQNFRPGTPYPELDELEWVFHRLFLAIFALAGLVAFVYFLIGGFKFLTAGGDDKAVGDAKKAITYAVAGLVMVVAIYFVMDVLNKEIFQGSDILQFVIPGP